MTLSSTRRFQYQNNQYNYKWNKTKEELSKKERNNNYILNSINIKRKITWLCMASTFNSYGKKIKLCISQFQLRPAKPPPPTPMGYCGAFACLVSPRGGPRHLQTPGPFLSFWHACCFLSEYIAKQRILLGKTSILAHLSRTGKNWRGL